MALRISSFISAVSDFHSFPVLKESFKISVDCAENGGNIEEKRKKRIRMNVDISDFNMGLYGQKYEIALTIKLQIFCLIHFSN
jgi:hypothetical protein